MKRLKRAVTLFCLLALPFSGFSQTKTIEKGNFLLNPSVTLGWYDYGYGHDPVNILPPVGLNFEIATSDYLSFGLEADYGFRRYRDYGFLIGTSTGNEYEYTYKALSFRGSFHYMDWFKDILSDQLGSLNDINLDLYVGASLGVMTTESNQKWNDLSTSQKHERKSFSSGIRYGYIFGARYYFSNNFGVFAEGGRNNLGWLRAGLTLKF